MDDFNFSGIAQLKDWLVKERKKEFINNLSKRMLAFALGRKVEVFDQGPLLDIQTKLEANDYKALTLLEEIVLSYPFLHQNNISHKLADL